MFNNFLKTFSEKPRCAIFLSGSGSNAEQLLLKQQNRKRPSSWECACLVTDRPEQCNARRIANQFGLPLIEHDIFQFYRNAGMEKVSIAGERAMQIREDWTEELRKKLAGCRIDFGVLAGFIPLSNIVSDFPCLNVHPGDLTVIGERGERLYVGLHKIPVEKAILAGETTLRSSVIVVEPFTAGAPEMDSGFLLGISNPVRMEFKNHSLEEIQTCAACRIGKKRSEYKNDLLSELAEFNLNHLKIHGDWVLLTEVVEHFAAGVYASDAAGNLYYNGTKIRTVEFSGSEQPRIIEA